MDTTLADGKVCFIRADADAGMGTGHLMRSLALGRAWQEQGGHTVFVTACHNQALLDRIVAAGLQLVVLDRPHPAPEDLETTLGSMVEYHGAWLVIDGYHFDVGYQRAVKETGANLVAIDDYVHAEHYHADLIVNQNLYADQLEYPCDANTRLLLGTRYALLSPDFGPWRRLRERFYGISRSGMKLRTVP